MEDAQRVLRALGLGDRGLELSLCENVLLRSSAESALQVDPNPPPISAALRPGSVLSTCLSLLANDVEDSRFRPLSLVSEGLYKDFPILPALEVSEGNFGVISRLKLACDRCRAISLEPVTAHPCGHTLCRDCLAASDGPCPVCGEHIALGLYDVPAITRLARSVMFRCGGSPNCGSKGPLSKVLRHMQHCSVVQQMLSASAWRESQSGTREPRQEMPEPRRVSPALSAAARAGGQPAGNRAGLPAGNSAGSAGSAGSLGNPSGHPAAHFSARPSARTAASRPVGASSRLSASELSASGAGSGPAAAQASPHGLSVAAAERLLASVSGDRSERGEPELGLSGHASRAGDLSPPMRSLHASHTPRESHTSCASPASPVEPQPHLQGQDRYLVRRIQELEGSLRQKEAEIKAAEAKIAALEERTYRVAAEKERIGEVMVMSLRTMKRCAGEGEDAPAPDGQPDKFEEDLMDLMARSHTRPWEDGGDEEAHQVEESLRASRLARSAARSSAGGSGSARPDASLRDLAASRQPNVRAPRSPYQSSPENSGDHAPVSYIHGLSDTSQGILAAARASEGCARGVSASSRLGGTILSSSVVKGSLGESVAQQEGALSNPPPYNDQAARLSMAESENAILRENYTHLLSAVKDMSERIPDEVGAGQGAFQPGGANSAASNGPKPFLAPPEAAEALERISRRLFTSDGREKASADSWQPHLTAGRLGDSLSRVAASVPAGEVESLLEVGQLQARMEQLREIYDATVAENQRLREWIAGIERAYGKLSSRYAALTGEE